MFGTAPYTAPELIELSAKRDFPSDVYSRGMYGDGGVYNERALSHLGRRNIDMQSNFSSSQTGKKSHNRCWQIKLT